MDGPNESNVNDLEASLGASMHIDSQSVLRNINSDAGDRLSICGSRAAQVSEGSFAPPDGN